jgi:hypothetical protein
MAADPRIGDLISQETLSAPYIYEDIVSGPFTAYKNPAANFTRFQARIIGFVYGF